tara:strand:+ start:1395 stop:1703 length:309 start_codon:yes stop_codon:yes gene_type:complete
MNISIKEYINGVEAVLENDMSEEEFEDFIEDMRDMFHKVGNPSISNRLEIIKDKIDNPNTPSKVRWEFLMFLMEHYLPNYDILKWIKKLEEITEGFIDEARN